MTPSVWCLPCPGNKIQRQKPFIITPPIALSSLTLRSCATVVRAKRKRRDSKSSYDTVMQFYVQMIPRYKYSIQSHVFHSISDKYRHTDQTTSSKRSQLFFTASSNTTVTGGRIIRTKFHVIFSSNFTDSVPSMPCRLTPTRQFERLVCLRNVSQTTRRRGHRQVLRMYRWKVQYIRT